MPRVLILVEGQTEEVFVRGVLAPHLVTRGVHLHTTIVATRRVHSGGHFNGGITRYEPYLALHEFEAMVFVDPRRAEWVFANAAVVTGLEQIGTGFSSPEEIDEGPDTAPSKRIRGLFPGY